MTKLAKKHKLQKSQSLQFQNVKSKIKTQNTKDIIEKITECNHKRMQNKKGDDNLEDVDFRGMMLTIILLLFALEQEDYFATFS